MTARIQSQTRTTGPRFTLKSLLNRVLTADARYREAARMRRLTPEARADMGLPPRAEETSGKIADRRFLSDLW